MNPLGMMLAIKSRRGLSEIPLRTIAPATCICLGLAFCISSGEPDKIRPSEALRSTITSITGEPLTTEPTATSSLHTTSPCGASTVPQCSPTTVFPKTTRKPITKTTRQPHTMMAQKHLIISESRLWHRCIAHNNHTALRSLIDGYTKDDSMCTACIQAQHK